MRFLTETLMTSWLKLLLIGSLALNAALVGVVAGRWLTPQGEAATPGADIARSATSPDVVTTAWGQLSEADRSHLRQDLRASWAAMGDDRRRLAEAGRAVYQSALVEPFDEARLRDAVAIFQLREKTLQSVVEDVLIRRLSGMPPEVRAQAAAGLLTPFYGRIQRADLRERLRRQAMPAPPPSSAP